MRGPLLMRRPGALGNGSVLFWRELMSRPGTVGAICASSPRLAARMAAQIDPMAPGWVVELGGGTGVITRALLARGVAVDRLLVVERSAALVRHLRQRLPAVQVLHGDAAELPALLAAAGAAPKGPATPSAGASDAPGAGAPPQVAAIVSGLPLLSIPEPVRSAIMLAAAAVLPAGAPLVQFTYALAGPSPWQRIGFTRLRSERVMANLPPARIDVLHGPAHRSADR